MRPRLIILGALAAAIGVGISSWVTNAPSVNHWLAVQTGTVNESGPYYAFWSGFGSDLAEFGIIGALGTGVYQLIRKYNCHESGCWRVGNHPAAGGQFLLCYRHHPDYHGARPTSEMIKRLHREHVKRQEILRDKLDAKGPPIAPVGRREDVELGSTASVQFESSTCASPHCHRTRP